MVKETIIKSEWFSVTVIGEGGGVSIQNVKSSLVCRAGGGQEERSHSSPTWVSISVFTFVCEDCSLSYQIPDALDGGPEGSLRASAGPFCRGGGKGWGSAPCSA